MGDAAESTLNINIRTAADAAALKTVQGELQKVTIEAQNAAQAGEQLATAHGKAGAAAEGHAHSNSTLRLATRGANDAAFAITDLMQGNMLVAFHRAKFAAEDLGIAMKTAFAPTAIVVGLTLGIELLSHYVMASNEAGEATKQHGEKAEHSAEQVFDLTTALRDQNRATQELLAPTVGETHALDEMQKVAQRTSTTSAALKQDFEDIKHAADELAKSLVEQGKQLDQATTATKKLIDAQKELVKAQIELSKAQGKTLPDDAANQASVADKKAELEKLEADARLRSVKEQIAQKAAANVGGKAAVASSDAAEARQAFKANDASAEIQQAAQVGVNFDKLTSGADYAKLADDFRKRLADPSGDAGPEALAAINAAAAKIENAGKLFDAAVAKTRNAADLEAQAGRFTADSTKLARDNAPQAQIDEVRRKTINTELDTIGVKQKQKEDREAMERAKKELEDYIKQNANSPAAAEEAQRRLAKVNLQLDVGRAPNEPEAQGRNRDDERREIERRFAGNPANVRIAQEAMDATNGKANDQTVSGNIAQKIQEAAKSLAKGENVSANEELIHTLMKQFLDEVKALHQTDRRADERFRQIEQELKTISSQAKNSRQ